MEAISPTRHSYSLKTMTISIRLVLYALTSLRGARKCIEIFSSEEQKKYPSFVSIQNWLLKLGYYELTRNKGYKEDWIYLVDNSVRLGQKKCFVVLGVRLETLEKKGYELSHKEVDVLSLQIISQCDGHLVNGYLEETANKFGVPYQIVSDYGSDIKKGVDLFCQAHNTTFHTYDVTGVGPSFAVEEDVSNSGNGLG